jgi:RNA polymerase sigma factor (sigma-70 family)
MLVELLVAGDPRGLAGVYDTYASRLYAYCTTVLRNREAAADALHDTLLVARERAGQLRDPDRLRPWLYAIARNECLRTLRDQRRTTELDEAGEMTDEAADLEAGLRAGEMRELVWAAAESLNPGEREVLELSVRHGLEGADLADALGVPLNQAHAQASRARTQLERALAVLIVARTGRQDCAELDGLLGDWDGHLTPLLRKRLGRHLERCDICGEQRRRRVSAAALLAGVPILAAPPALRDRIMHEADDMRLVSMWAALAERAGPYRPDGFPRPLPRGHRRAAIAWWATGAAAVVLLLILGATVVLPQPTPKPAAGQAIAASTTDSTTTAASTDPPSSTADTTTTAPATTATTTTPAPTTTVPPATTTVAVPIQPTTTAAPTTTRRTTTAPPPPTTTRPPPPPTLTASTTPDGTSCPNRQWVAHLTATVRNGVANAVRASWTEATGAPAGGDMKPGPNGVWTLDVPVPSTTNFAWTATAKLPTRTLTASSSAVSPCPSIG